MNFSGLLLHRLCLPHFLLIYHLRGIADSHMVSFQEKQVASQSALCFFLPILSSLASSSSPDQIAIASSFLSRLYGLAPEQLLCPAIESDPNLKVSSAGSKDNDPISTLAATVLAFVEEFPQLSSEKTLHLLADAYRRRSVSAGPSQMGLLLADVIVRESLSLDGDTVDLVCPALRLWSCGVLSMPRGRIDMSRSSQAGRGGGGRAKCTSYMYRHTYARLSGSLFSSRSSSWHLSSPPHVAIRFVDHLNSRRIDIDVRSWQYSAWCSVLFPYKPLCPERVVRLYKLVPEEHRGEFEESV